MGKACAVAAGVILALALAATAAAQGPRADWQTVETGHFRVHYPAPAEAWARRAAARLEAIRERVGHEVGYTPPETVDVLVVDPTGRANGVAWPILGWPRLVLYTTPPPPSSILGHYRDAGEELIVHEVTHLAHLLRRSRDPWRRRLERWLPIGPLPQRTPLWAIEGYATYLEGRLTGHGRPHSDLRASILRRWGQRGELPSYARLSADGHSWLGMSMAYLAGSAYLEWLIERGGPESLRQLWVRLSARHQRGFDEAFRGVFGDSPRRLYNRFRAELTYRALRLEEEMADEVREGELWQDLSWTSGIPAVSPDGEHLAIVLRSRDAPPRLVVWSTQADAAAEERWLERRRQLLAQDPDDVPAVRTAPLPRQPVWELAAGPDAAPSTPRWEKTGKRLLYVRFEPDRDGFLHPDLFRWEPASGRVDRLTHGGDLRDPDPAPSGDWAVAVRQRHGLSQLVRVDTSGTSRQAAVAELTDATAGAIYSRPRISPDGRRLAFLRHRDGGWRLVVTGLEADGDHLVGPETVLPSPPRALIADPAWTADGHRLVATLGSGGFLDLVAWEPAGGEPQRLTRGLGAALAPAPAPDGAIFYLALEADGLDLRRLPSPPPSPLPALDLAGRERAFAPVLRPPAIDPPPPAEAAVAGGEPYGAGRIEVLPLLGGRATSSGDVVEAGVRLGDVVGRLDLVALLAAGEGGAVGGAARLAWRGAPIEIRAHLVAAEEQPSARRPAGTLQRGLDVRRLGLEVSGRWRRLANGGRSSLVFGAYGGEVEPVAGRALSQELLFAVGEQSWWRRTRGWRVAARIAAGGAFGRTDGDGWHRYRTGLRLEGGRRVDRRRGLGVAIEWRHRRVSSAVLPIDQLQLGGLRGSLLPASAVPRIEVPALPAGILVGDDYEGQRAELDLGRLPLTFFWERHRLRPEADGWLALRGVEARWYREPWPLLRLPGFDLRFGLAEILDPPFEDEIEAWLSLAFHP